MATTVAAIKQQSNTGGVFEELLSRRTFSPDAYHVMQERDNELIADQLLHGASRKDFIYSFSISGKLVTGISVVGARELASQYKGIKSRIVASTEKRGALFIFRTFEPLGIETRQIEELEDDVDFYEVVMEITDIKTGNSIQVRKSENKLERKSSGSAFERPHYSVIAESKAFRNGVLAVLPQSVLAEFEEKCLKAGNTSNEKTIDQLRSGAAGFCAKHSIRIDRSALSGLTFAELSGLSAAASQGVESFCESAAALGLVSDASHDPEKILSEAAKLAIKAISAATDLSGITRALSGLKPADKAAVKPYAEARQAEIKSARQPDPQDDALTALEQRGSVDQETGEWTPSPEEMAAIHAREIAEGGGK